MLVNFFWGGNHWTSCHTVPACLRRRAWIDLTSAAELTTFHLQTVQCLLYHMQKMWTQTALQLLCWVKNLGYNKHIILLDLEKLDISNTSSFYQPVLCVWKSVLAIRRDSSLLYSKMGEGPLFYNPFIEIRLSGSLTLQRVLIGSRLTKLSGLRSEGQWKSAARLSQETGITSLCLLNRLLE